MLALVATDPGSSPEEVDLDLSFGAELTPQDYDSPWFAHPLVLRGILRNGTQVKLGLTMTECVRVFVAMQADAALRTWVETVEAMRDGTQPS